MENHNKKRYYTANLNGAPFALHCSSWEVQLLSRAFKDVQPCSKAEYQTAREAGARCYADALEITNRLLGLATVKVIL